MLFSIPFIFVRMKLVTDLEQTMTLLEHGFNNNDCAFTIGDLINYLPKYIYCRGYLCIMYIGYFWQVNYNQDFKEDTWQSKELIDALYESIIQLKEEGII